MERIVVYNHKIGYNFPTKLITDAICVGGEEGILALFKHPKEKDLVAIAKGDDGNWQLMWIVNKFWLKEIISSFKEFNKILN